MSKKISIQNKPGLPGWALTDLLLVARRFHCHITLHDDEITIDGKKLLEVISLIRPNLSSLVVMLKGNDEEEALEAILNSGMGRFATRRP
jgi:phosphotransferase system HPr (HPr) family protein